MRGRGGNEVLINPTYAKLWASQAVSAVGDSVFRTTLVLWVAYTVAAGRPWAPAAAGGLLVAAGAGAALAGPAAGVFVDRWDRTAVMTGTEVLRAVLAGAITALSFLPVRELPAWMWLAAVYVAVFALSGVGQFFAPAMLAVISDIVPDEAGRARAAGLAEAAASAAGIIGPMAAAPLLFTAGVQWALAVNTASYIVSFLAVRSVRIRATALRIRATARTSAVAGLRTEFTAGLRVFFRHRFLMALVTVTVLCQAGTSAVTALNVWFVTGYLHQSSRMFGVAEAVMGVGFVIGAIIAGRMVRRVGTRTLVWTGLLAAAGLTAGYAMQRDFLVSLVVLCLYAGVIGMLTTAVAPLLMGAAPREYMGRVLSVYIPLNQIAFSGSVMAWGWLASADIRDIRLLLIVASGIILIAGVRAFTALPAPSSSVPSAVPSR
jgi:MFS family permease